MATEFSVFLNLWFRASLTTTTKSDPKKGRTTGLEKFCMYNYITGKIVEKNLEKNVCIIEVNGIGYEIFVPTSVLEQVGLGEEKKFFVVEISGGFYTSGLPSLYGFLTKEEKEIFLVFKENLSNVGPKKALEYVDKVNKNLGQFVKAVLNKDYKILTTMFGFRKSTAEKIINSLSSLKDFYKESFEEIPYVDIDIYTDIVSALVNLGYKEQFAKLITEKVIKSIPQEMLTTHKIAELLKLVLNEISKEKKL